MTLFKQVCRLMWKNWLIQRRRLVVSIVEVFLPALFSFLITTIRDSVEPTVFSQLTCFEHRSIVANPDCFPEKGGIIGYVPASIAAADVMNHVLLLLMRNMPPDQNLSLQGFTTEEESVIFYHTDTRFLRHVVVFYGVSSTSIMMPKKVSFAVRPHSEDTKWQTYLLLPILMDSKPRPQNYNYRQAAVLYLQGLVGEALARYWIDKDGGNPDSIGFEIYSKRFVFPPYYSDPLTTVLHLVLPLFIVVSFMISVVIGTKNLVTEKEKKLKESMKLMGLTSTAYWLSWYLTLCVYLVPAMALYTMMFTLKVSSKGPVLYHTSGSLLFVLLLVYAHAIITYCFMVSTLVEKANVAAIVSGMVFFLSYLPSTFLIDNYQTSSRRDKLLFCLLFNTAMSMAINELSAYEGSGEGLTWSNINYRPSDRYSINVLDCVIMMLISSTIHMIITWYLNNVRPGDFGVPKPYHFCFMKSYWFGSPDTREGSFRFDLPQSKYFEKDSGGKTAGIRICNLRKEFGKRVAVAGTSLNMYEGQITVLLGHNGAGKTTTMAMITGFIPPTSGTAIVNGYDIRTHIDEVRNSMGLCPQHDILFDTVTVSEHFQFFSKMKGYFSPTLKEEILELATKVGLEGKLNTYSNNLSGGQKRKLSVGIALIGGSKVVILDEPSSGMDPAARRQTWSVLQEARQGRTILLTTHYMDEADLLGDRIAIMAGGVIKCCGTSMFLKKLYGAGYHLIVVTKPTCDISNLTTVIRSVIPKATFEVVVNTEVTYLLPDNESKTFADLFRLLDTQMARLKISSYGLSATTMEEVFLKVGEPGNDDDVFDGHSSRSSRIPFGSTAEGGHLFLTVMQKSETDVANITDAVHSFFPTAEPTQVSNKVVTYQLPNNDSGKVADLSAWLESNKDALNINTFSTSSLPTIVNVDEKEVSLEETPENYSSNARRESDTPSCDFNTGYSKEQGVRLQLSRLVGILVKKALVTWRSRIITLVQLILPGLFTFLLMLAATSQGVALKDEALTLNIVPFGETYIPYTDGYAHAAKGTLVADLYKRQFCSCHKTEYIRLKDGKTFDNVTSRKVLELSKSDYFRTMVIGMEVVPSSSPEKIAAIAYFNSQPLHSEGISVNYVVNALLQSVLNTSFAIKSAIAPLPSLLEEQQKIYRDLNKDNRPIGFPFATSIVFGMSCMTTLFIASLIKERQTGAKHMQQMTGISPVIYWVPTFLWDLLVFLVASLAIPVILKVYTINAYTQDGRSALVILVLAVYGWAVLPLLYSLQFLFRSPPSGIAMVVMFSFMSGVATTLTMTIVNTPELKMKDTADLLDRLFTLAFPNYNLATCFINIDQNFQNLQICLPRQDMCRIESTYACCKDTCKKEDCIQFETDYLSRETFGIGTYLIAMACQGVIFFLVVMAIEYKVIPMVWYAVAGADTVITITDKGTEDSDVAAERKRITSTPISTLISTDSLVLINLYKRYYNFIAVDHTCVGIKERECFGLLGQNGAGKTTTFKMITGDIMLTGGNAYLKGFDVRTNIKQVQTNMGYCPQFDPLIDVLTGRETLTMYARLRGIPESSIDRVIVTLAEFIKLTEYLDDFCGNYSGGNKRKLSTAIALIGDPPFIMLDEPSSGMDPEARRSLWTVLSRVRASGRTLVLTSHSMEECDALCTRIAIMVNGKFVCLGSPQHLKSKFGQGYTLIIKLGSQEDGSFDPSQPIIERIQTTFPGAVVFDDHEGYIHFQVPYAKVKVADIFSAMEGVKEKFKLEDYSVHQTTLEQVFLAFTNKQILAPENTEAQGLLSTIFQIVTRPCRRQ